MIRTLSIPLVNLLLVTSAFAQEHAEGHEADLSSLTLPALNFAVFLVVMTFIYRKKVQPLLKARSLEVSQSLNQTAEAELKAEEELSVLRDALETIDDEEIAVIAAFKEEGIRSADVIRKQMLDEVHRIEKEAEQLKENLVNQLESEIRIEMTGLAMKKAQESLSQNFTTEMDRSLRRDILQNFQK